MSFTVYTSNRMEMLATQLGEVLARPLSLPLASEVVVVQSKGMQRWLAMELAKRYGVWANCCWPFPNKFVWDIFTATMPALPAGEPFAPARMQWRIMRLLDGLLDQSEFAEIKGYLTGINPGLKKYQLAGKIADTFDQYTLFRGDLLAEWEAGGDDSWQARLWRALVAESEGIHRGRVQTEFLRRLAAGEVDAARLPQRITVFGISYLPAFHLQVLAGLASRTEVNLFIMSPCQEYWGDILPGQVTARLTPAEREKIDEGNALLASLGRLGRDFSNLLLECGAPCGGERNLYQQAAGESLLALVQNDILNLSQAEAGDTRRVAADGSIRIHSCHSAMREVEVLHDNLLQLFAADPELQPRDILVMTPDIETYSAYIAAVFDGSDNPLQRIPYSIADRTIRSNGKLADALIAILDLAGQRFTAPAVMAILAVPAVYARFGLVEADLDLVKQWLEETAIRWGLDEHDREMAGLQPYREQSWLAGLERLLLGYAMPEENERLFGGILPYDNMEGGSSVTLGRLVAFVREIHSVVAGLGAPRPLAAWSELLQTLFGNFFAPGETEEREAVVIGRIVNELAALQTETAFTSTVELPVVRAWLQGKFAVEEQGLGFLSGGVTFCAMLPMRSIPFKVIALIGMNDGLFPRQSRPPGFDLISRSPRPGDRSLRHEDRYLFLESILSARQLLYISFTGQSIRDNSVVPPSTLVSELLDYLQRNYAAADGTPLPGLLTSHRLQPFSVDYFNGTTGLFSYSRENFEAIERKLTTARAYREFIGEALPPPPAFMRDVSLGALFSFYANPAAYLLRHRLGIRLEGPAPPLEEREAFAIDGLDAYGLKQEILERTVAGKDVAELLTVAKARGQLPPARHGELLFAKLVAEAAELAAAVEKCGAAVEKCGAAAERLAPLDFDLQLGDFRLHGRLDNILEDQLLRYRCAKLGAKDKIRFWIEHLLLNLLGRDGYPLASCLIMTDAAVHLPPYAEAEEGLQQLLALYWQGLHRPLKFFPRSSLACARTGRVDDAARIWNAERFPESADRCYRLCFGETSPLDDEFVDIAFAVFGPYLRQRRGA
jgi:exodeoxyribonuclease V gamma subunit